MKLLLSVLLLFSHAVLVVAPPTGRSCDCVRSDEDAVCLSGLCQCFYPPENDDGLLTRPCSFGACCIVVRNRSRRLGDAGFDWSKSYQGSITDEPEYKELQDYCGDYDYDGFLLVQEAMFSAIALPKEEAKEAGCPVAVTRIGYAADGVTGIKKLSLWGNYEEFMSTYDMKLGYPIGQFKFSELAKAYEDTDFSGEIDLVHNNCAKFVIDIGLKLGVKIDHKVTSYVTRRLMNDSGSQLTKLINEGLDYFSDVFGNLKNRRLGSDNGKVDDEQVIELLVEEQASILF